MLRSRPRAALTLLASLIALCAAGAAWSQPAPSAKPGASAATKASGSPAAAKPGKSQGADQGASKSDKPAASASPSADAQAKPPEGAGALPPGHPSINSGLPQGHPPVDDDGADEGDDDGDAAAAPPGHAHGGMPNEAPEDIATDDTSLPPGVFVVTIKDGQDRPIPRAPIKLNILHSSVAKGDSTEEQSRVVDDQGTARFEGMTIGSGTTYRITTTRGPAAYTVGPFALTDRQGKQVVLHSYEVVTDIEGAPIGMQAIVYLSLREDSISVEHLFSIFNLGTVAWVPSVTIPLPSGFKAFNKQDDSADIRFDEVSGKGAALRGTVSPGRHDVTFRYQVPLSGDDHQTLRIGLPPHVAQGRVMVEVSKTMGVEVAGFPAAQKTQNRDGKRLLVTDQQVTRSEGGLKSFEITLTGLPTPGPGRWIAAVLAACALVGAAVYTLRHRDDDDLPDDARDDLLDAREALLGEIVELERAHRRGDIGPKTYARLRAALLDSLARIVAMLEGARASKQAPKKPAPAEPASAAEPP